MNSTPTQYLFSGRTVRVIIDQEAPADPWWVAKDVCDILGYANTSKARPRVFKGMAKRGG